MPPPSYITEAEIIAAIAEADRYVVRDGLSLPPLTSALAEIWALMLYERVEKLAIERLSGTQRAAWEHCHQAELIVAPPSPEK